MATPQISKSLYAIVAGVGGGTGRAVALRFARAYPVAVLARSESSYADVVAEITQRGGEAVGVSADVADEKSLAHALGVVKEKFADKGLAAAVCKSFFL
jgi:NAD(P)-dependent dehydrogenase (short-subunit alcohol dehydrogenase family)